MTKALQPNSAASRADSVMVRIPGGFFLMGSETGQENERPVHRVWIEAFEIGACQVTNADYNAFLAATKRQTPPQWRDPSFSDPDQPVVAISWFDATAYCEWLSLTSGPRYRLPTEAEWERAARGGAEQKQFPWGDEPPESLTNYAQRWKTGPERVGRAEQNAYGLFDIGANVHEWCADWFGAEYYAQSPERNPPGPAVGERRSSRGGSWRHYTKVSRLAARSSIPPEFRYADYGFRVVRDVAG
ncbi:MAG: formylglycine-generating enzyme family protein [Candidatus Acidiferrales bacterium]